ncbi:PTS system cellobiose-specific IIA component [Breznakia pachnodae]|uniref:PTS system cellobiose-specific IIA component n=2 Tax=Breznakia pachnodae TaxID=265178 RepID=A0ABU0E1A6_9FIRM|nr:PTS system cellobiose-specific IIA component [Breznakia pachnodae]
MPKMDEQESQEVAFTIILHSGSARSLVHEGLGLMREGKFEEAEAKLNEGEEELVQAHQAQTNLLHKFSHGTTIEIQIIMVHAQDHLMTTMTLLEVAKEMKYLYERTN